MGDKLNFMDKDQIRKTIYTLSALAGLLLIFFGIELFRLTIVAIKIPILVTVVFTVITFVVIRKDYKMLYNKKNEFYPFMQSFLSAGLIGCYLFFALNYYMADRKTQTRSYRILSKYSIGGSDSQPAVNIDYKGAEKELVFNPQQQKRS